MNKTKKIYKVSGMDCAACATLLELDLEDAGIKAFCSYPKETLEVNGDHDEKLLKETIKKSGFGVLNLS